MRRLLVVALLSSLAGCSLDSAGTADSPAEELDTGTSSGDTAVAGDDTSTAVDSGTPDDTSAPPEDSAVVDSTVTDSTVADTAIDTLVPDTFVPDTAVTTDTFVPDTAVSDTAVTTDTFVPDTFVADTFVADTFVPDTFVPDTFVPDTFVPDTFVADTFVPDTALGPVLSCSTTAPTSTVSVNLTTEGTIDWAHWGYGAIAATLGAFNHKSTMAGSIIKGSVIGTALPWGSYPTQFSWSNGTPTTSVTNTTDGEYVGGKGDGFSYEVTGDPTVERTLTAYFTWAGSTGTIDAKLSDGSVAAYSTAVPPSGVAVGTGIKPQVLTCKFRPSSPSVKLVVAITQTTNTGYTSRIAATLK